MTDLVTVQRMMEVIMTTQMTSRMVLMMLMMMMLFIMIKESVSVSSGAAVALAVASFDAVRRRDDSLRVYFAQVMIMHCMEVG
jgi:hypothetical protein